MKIYTDAEERLVHARRQARAWARSGLMTEEQRKRAEAETDTGLVETNLFLRVLLFGFAALCLGAVVSFFFWASGIRRPAGMAVLMLVFCGPAYALAEFFVRRSRFYRHGVEEALAAGATYLACGGLGLLFSEWGLSPARETLVLCLLAFAGGVFLYLRFGYLYAVFAAVIALAFVPFQFSLAPLWERTILFVLLAVCLAANGWSDRGEREDFRKERNAFLQGALLLGLSLTGNLRLTEIFGRGFPGAYNAGQPGGFYWTTYAVVWLLPIFGFYFGLRGRKRALIVAAGVAGLLTLVTNKSYLEMKRYAWDPAILGVVLAGTAIFLMRWLNRGPGRARWGFTADNLLKPENHGVDAEALGVAVFGAPDARDAAAAPAPGPGGGGASGGAGASSGF